MEGLTVAEQRLLAGIEGAVPDAHVVAKSLVDSARRLRRDTPTVAHLTSAIQDILPESHIAGASVLKIPIIDQSFELLGSNFFSPADDHHPDKKTQDGKKKKDPLAGLPPGALDPLEINYPQGSKYWWRLSTISPRSNGTMDLTFIDRVADELMNSRGPFKANRAKMTRAEFLKMVAKKATPGAHFYSHQLDVKQPVAPIQSSGGGSGPSSSSTSGPKSGGLGANTKGLTVKGSPISSTQVGVADAIMAGCAKHNASENVTVAAVYAAIGESDLSPSNTFGRTSVTTATTADDIEAWLTGGPDFTGHGGLQVEQSNPNYAAWQIANDVERNARWNGGDKTTQASSDSYYNQAGGSAFLGEAQRIVQAGGGASGGGSLGAGTSKQVIQPYFFAIGSGETDWDGSQRLAQEVNWRYLTDGPDIYYDSEMTLIKQKPVAVIHRSDDEVLDWSYDWENRNIATAFTLTIICGLFQFRAGDVFILKGFGVDHGSTAKLPGRWLVQDVVRQGNSFASQITLKQPEQPKDEPAPQVTTVTSSSSATALSGGGPAPGASPGRMDMGVDGNYGPQGAVAIYNGVLHFDQRGWPGDGDFIWIKNDDQTGPDYTRAIYYAEGAKCIVPDGAHVKAGQKIGTPVARGGNGSPGNFEIGPGNTVNGDPLVKTYGQGSARSVALVKAFAQWTGLKASSTDHAGSA